MRAILSRLSTTNDFDICVFGDKTILDEPISSWPTCDFLIAFHSRGFPSAKVVEYVQEAAVYCVNDVQMQLLLMDRRVVGRVLDAVDVPTPRRMWTRRGPPIQLPQELMDAVNRDFGITFGDLVDGNEPRTAVLRDNTVIINNDAIELPVVEKPADAEDHNINVLLDDTKYRRLFRKIGNKSSSLITEPSRLRDDQDYVYEQYLPSTMDIKVYTVGPHYIYGESRKAPTVDGVVERNADGKECRHRITLTRDEEETARRVCMAFGQTVCGLDMIRCEHGPSVVIDVNGWSFVKGNDEYYEKCAMILRDTFLRVSRRSLNLRAPIQLASDDAGGEEWRLERYVTVLRHADRTPKQKHKATVDFGLVEPIMADRLLVELQQYSAIKPLLSVLKPTHPDLYSAIKEKAKVPGAKVQLHRKPDTSTVTVSVKWGGDITHAGRHQARELGDTLKTDLLLLMRHCGTDLNILNTDTVRVRGCRERRVQATATVFAKALLGTAELPADFVTVQQWSSTEADTVRAKAIIDRVKDKLCDEYANDISLLVELVKSLDINDATVSVDDEKWCCGDSKQAFTERWRNLLASFKGDPSRIFDLYDTLKYDQIHHRQHLQHVFGHATLTTLIDTTQALFDAMSGSQYGATEDEQLTVARLLSGPLLDSVVSDLQGGNGGRQFNFYFTKESHVRCLYNVLRRRLGVPAVGELDYLSQVEVEVYARGRRERVVRVSVRQGAHLDCLSAGFESDRDHALRCQQRRSTSPFCDLDTALSLLRI